MWKGKRAAYRGGESCEGQREREATSRGGSQCARGKPGGQRKQRQAADAAAKPARQANEIEERKQRLARLAKMRRKKRQVEAALRPTKARANRVWRTRFAAKKKKKLKRGSLVGF
ncbi:hypothetical protein ISCGN_012714 [Ixodes scapularis]